MNTAPKIYDEEFYRQELDGQKKRLGNLKSRQVNRQMRFEKIVDKSRSTSTAPQKAADAAAKGRAARGEEERESNIEDTVLRALTDVVLELPCNLDAFVNCLENKPRHLGDVAAVLRSLGKKEHKKKGDTPSVSVELENADNAKKMIITAVHRSVEETSPSKRHRKE